jgi:hypothetical protein
MRAEIRRHNREGDMKRVFCTCVLTTVLLAASLSKGSAQGRFGVGFIFGDPTGFSWKYKISQQNALAGVLGFSPFDRFRFHVDYLWLARPFDNQNLSFSYGIGGAAGFGRTEFVVARGRNLYFARDVSPGFGIRGAFGLNYMIPRSPVELSLEVAPILIMTPATGMGVDGGVAVRFYP